MAMESKINNNFMARKMRGQWQAKRLVEAVMREWSEMKPFYLTLNLNGKPHGVQVSVGIAEINKLLSRLNRDCTNIWKQTFEDMNSFKSKLNKNFESSSTLNEDYLWSLMEKAVTKRRAEYLVCICAEGKQ